MKRYIIDRIEDGAAVCEDENGGHETFDASRMPPGAREGDCLTLCDGEGGIFVADAGETRRRREYMRELLRRAQDQNGMDDEIEETEE